MHFLRYTILACLLVTTPAFSHNPDISEDVWNTVAPYFLPENSQEKAALDKIFSKPGVLRSLKSLSNAGFLIHTFPEDKVIVLSHPYLRGYLVKVFLESQDNAEWHSWFRRARGAKVIQNAINTHGYQHLFKVPQKWIYALPYHPTDKHNGPYKKSFVLLVQKMDILNDKKNRQAYKKQITPEILDALYTLLTKYLLIDSVYADNIPFCRDGKMAFIDTEYTGDTTMDVPLSAIGQYLSPPMLAHWEQLIVNGISN